MGVGASVISDHLATPVLSFRQTERAGGDQLSAATALQPTIAKKSCFVVTRLKSHPYSGRLQGQR